MMPTTLGDMLLFIKRVFELVGVAIITRGCLIACIRYIHEALYNIGPVHLRYNRFRFTLARATIAGLEMIVAADVISTVNDQTYWELGIIFMLVVLRTTLSYSLTKDLEAINAQDKQILEAD